MTTHPEGLLQKLNVDDKRVDNQRLIIIDDLMVETDDCVVNLFSLAPQHITKSVPATIELCVCVCFASLYIYNLYAPNVSTSQVEISKM